MDCLLEPAQWSNQSFWIGTCTLVEQCWDPPCSAAPNADWTCNHHCILCWDFALDWQGLLVIIIPPTAKRWRNGWVSTCFHATVRLLTNFFVTWVILGGIQCIQSRKFKVVHKGSSLKVVEMFLIWLVACKQVVVICSKKLLKSFYDPAWFMFYNTE